jgi:biopolymer transport protein ExbB/TolQ
MMIALRNCLYLFSNALLPPVLLAVIVLAAWTALMIGGILAEWVRRPAMRRTLVRIRDAAHGNAEEQEAGYNELMGCKNGLPGRYAAMRRRSPGLKQTKCLEDLEQEVATALSSLTWITRVGPMLGLMGTLIPLGPALTGLATGDIAALSSNLVVAFTTTVAGVFIGCAGFTMGLIRRNWYNHDLSDLEYVVEHLSHYAPEKTKVG